PRRAATADQRHPWRHVLGRAAAVHSVRGRELRGAPLRTIPCSSRDDWAVAGNGACALDLSRSARHGRAIRRPLGRWARSLVAAADTVAGRRRRQRHGVTAARNGKRNGRVRKARPLRIAVVGLGYWGPNLVRVLHEIEAAEVVAVCDVDEAALAKIG